ncbi:right-handed parallel beta-helix repeat-containing protein, partial [Paraglaciecola sp. 25GB23A]|uniref:right-handed parallel beta-helix repeat-containing protein n=1 Tax=Paraglaciecola sp. 25GB23A TaxID=3156068 RepID=UPI0032AF17AF
MYFKLISQALLVLLILITFNATAENIHWRSIDSPILIDADVVIPAGDTLTIDAGTVIQFLSDKSLNVEGKIEIVDEGLVTLTSMSDEKWLGLNIDSKEVFVISNLHISNAVTGLKLISSPNVAVSNNLIENNGTGISLTVDDGVRSNVNAITDNDIRNNVTGISARSTGADIQRNLILNNTSVGISLSGGSCGGGSACGWRSNVQDNLIVGSETGINIFGHQLVMNNNDIYNSTIGISNRNLNNTSYNVTNNNIVGWSAFAYVNQSPDNVDLGSVWLGQPESEQSICDVEDNINRGRVLFAASSSAFPTNHNYDLPSAIASETQNSHPSCPDDGYQYVSTDMSWSNTESPITITESLFIASSATLTVEAGTEILFNAGIGLMVEGSLIVAGQSYTHFAAAQDEQWQGITFKRSVQEVITNLHISNAVTGLKLTSSPNVAVSNNLIENNGTGISLTVDD